MEKEDWMQIINNWVKDICCEVTDEDIHTLAAAIDRRHTRCSTAEL